MTTRFLLSLLLLVVSSIAHSEGGCPAGMIPYSGTSTRSCGPIQSGPGGGIAGPKWKTRWGAIASDDSGHYGVSVNQTSKARARDAAIEDCRGHGGQTCKLHFAYENQCVAVASSTAESFSASAATGLQATAISMERCEASKTGKCWLYYTDCSLAVRVR
ncbi:MULTISPECIES: DUF4189 domain-containing protein [Lysobacter]|uniref:DUF4189 domain-containing protein n=1 Tax=Lysobacter TaxID=68 RepID=UPI00137872B0|nr:MULTISPECIES: DUF4189 domain-containing protein [Lysobacter]